MNQDDLSKLADLIDERVSKALEPIKQTQKEQTETLEALQSSVINIENTINVYADMHKRNNSDSKKLEQRIEVLEDKSGVSPPPELTLTDVK